MVMSDRIALLRSGELEQVASPREIYARPATAYTVSIHRTYEPCCMPTCSMARRCAIRLTWPSSLPDGAALFSLRPESIRMSKIAPAAPASSAAQATVRFRAKLRDQAFHGATELLRVETDGGLLLTIRIASRDLPKGPAGIRIQRRRCDSGSCLRESASDVLARLSLRDHSSAAGLGDDLSSRSLSADVLLQLLVGLAVTDDRSIPGTSRTITNCS